MKPNRMLAPLLLVISHLACAAPPEPLKLPAFDTLAEKASESVNIALDSALLGLATRFLNSGSPQEAAVKQLVGGLKGIYVKSFTFDADFAYPKADVDVLLKQLEVSGWQRLVGVDSRKDKKKVDIFISLEQNVANGLAIISSDPREFTVVNIVGAIDLEKLHQLEGRFGIPKLDVGKKTK